MFAWTEMILRLTTLSASIRQRGLPPPNRGFRLNTSENGLAFDNSDVLTLVSPDGSGNTNAYSIDTTTGANTYLTTFIALPRAHHGVFDPRTNYYWGIDVTNNSGVATRNLLVLDIGTTTLVDTLPTADNLHCVTFGYMSVSN